jgi:hypothetical protein
MPLPPENNCDDYLVQRALKLINYLDDHNRDSREEQNATLVLLRTLRIARA